MLGGRQHANELNRLQNLSQLRNTLPFQAIIYSTFLKKKQVAVQREKPPPKWRLFHSAAGRDDQPLIWIFFCFASSALGNVSSRTPSRYFASIFSGSTVLGKVKEREKVPW